MKVTRRQIGFSVISIDKHEVNKKEKRKSPGKWMIFASLLLNDSVIQKN